MNGFKQVSLALATAGMLSSGVAQAALVDRGEGLLYDTVLNLTWMQDANYLHTIGDASGGRMTWTQANTWASNLVFAGVNGWRLATNTPLVGPDWNGNHSFDGSTDIARNITSPRSELSYMYYVNLGLTADYSALGISQSNSGIFGNGTIGGQADVGLVRNLQSAAYWSGALYPPGGDAAFEFLMGQGVQTQTSPKDLQFFYVWAVHPGDIAASVPEPETYTMLLAGLGLLGVVARRRKQQSAV